MSLSLLWEGKSLFLIRFQIPLDQKNYFTPCKQTLSQWDMKQYIRCQKKLVQNKTQPSLIKIWQHFMKFVPFRGEPVFPWNIPKSVFLWLVEEFRNLTGENLSLPLNLCMLNHPTRKVSYCAYKRIPVGQALAQTKGQKLLVSFTQVQDCCTREVTPWQNFNLESFTVILGDRNLMQKPVITC